MGGGRKSIHLCDVIYPLPRSMLHIVSTSDETHVVAAPFHARHFRLVTLQTETVKVRAFYTNDTLNAQLLCCQAFYQLKVCLLNCLFFLSLMSPPCQFYNTGFTYLNLHYIITMLKSFNIRKYSLF